VGIGRGGAEERMKGEGERRTGELTKWWRGWEGGGAEDRGGVRDLNTKREKSRAMERRSRLTGRRRLCKFLRKNMHLGGPLCVSMDGPWPTPSGDTC
jgi:hypothetical protein